MTQQSDCTRGNEDHSRANDRTRGNDDRRGEVKPTDRPVPHSPEPEEDSVREGEEKLERVKPY